MADTVAIVFEEVGEGLFRPLRLEEEVEGHLRRSREDLSSVALEGLEQQGETLYRIRVAGGDDVAGHAGSGLFYYRRRPDQPGVDDRPDDDVSGHRLITPPGTTIP